MPICSIGGRGAPDAAGGSSMATIDPGCTSIIVCPDRMMRLPRSRTQRPP